MTRQKKIVPYVTNTKIVNREDCWSVLWAQRDKLTLDSLMKMADARCSHNPAASPHGSKSYSEYFGKMLANSVNPVDESNWREQNDSPYRKGRDEPKHHHIMRLLRCAYPASQAYENMNRAFLAEYDSREDLQEIYKKFFGDMYCVDDQWGNRHWINANHYNIDAEAGAQRQDFIKANSDRPTSYLMYVQVVETNAAKRFIEENRETPYEVGDLVKLRDPFVGHCDWDPQWVSAYEAHRTGVGTPDKSTPRIGTVFSISNVVNWHGTKGSKQIEIQWFGKDGTVRIPENKLKWECRPTKKNGLLK